MIEDEEEEMGLTLKEKKDYLVLYTGLKGFFFKNIVVILFLY